MKFWIVGSQGLVGSYMRGFGLATSRLEVDAAEESEVEAFLQKHPEVTHIVNCAAFSEVDAAENRREEAYLGNVIVPKTLAKVAKRKGLYFLHLSTDYVFRGEKAIPLKESDPTDPCNYYGMTKRMGEEAVQRVSPYFGILRTSWVFGKGGKNLLANVKSLLQEKETLSLVSDQWGRATYVKDLCTVIQKVLEKQLAGIYQFANEGVTNKYAFVEHAYAFFQKKGRALKAKKLEAISHKAFASPCQRPLYSAFDTTKIEGECDIKPRSWKEALEEFLCET